MPGWVCYDGSCAVSEHPELRRAAWAVVEVNGKGEVTATLSGPVWASLPQTPQAAEFSARAAATQRANGPLWLIGDCSNVVRDDKDLSEAARRAENPKPTGCPRPGGCWAS